ncbi:MAG: hypothetical protein QXP20_05035, partial [Candidatus Bathyarchaeia archaeon]
MFPRRKVWIQLVRERAAEILKLNGLMSTDALSTVLSNDPKLGTFGRFISSAWLNTILRNDSRFVKLEGKAWMLNLKLSERASDTSGLFEGERSLSFDFNDYGWKIYGCVMMKVAETFGQVVERLCDEARRAGYKSEG